MSLEPLDLDDLTWSDLVDQAIESIPAESRRQWTLHAPVDPGVTILELYAARLEERLFWIDRIPDDLVRAVLRLLGSAPPQPPRPATTVLRLGRCPEASADGGGQGPRGDVLVPAGSAFGRRDAAPSLDLLTGHGLTVLDGIGIHVEIDGLDRTIELGRTTLPSAIAHQAGSPGVTRPGIDLLPADGGPGMAELVLRRPAPDGPPIGSPEDGAPLGIAFEFETPTGLLPGWAVHRPLAVPAPAELRWSYRNADGRSVDLDPDGLDDGTGGLRRSGILRFANRADGWRSTGGGEVELRIQVSTEACTFSAPPRLTGLWPNAVAAVDRRPVDAATEQIDSETTVRDELIEQIDADWLPLPGLELSIPATEDRLLRGSETPRLQLTESDGQARVWLPVDDFAAADSGARVFVVDRDRGVLGFGDGYAGRIPVPGRLPSGAVEGLDVHYELGGGTAIHQGSNIDWDAADPDLGIEAVNVVPVAAGADAESVDQARRRAKADMSRRHRAVVEDDHRALVDQTESTGVAVARVNVVPGRHPAHPCRQVPGAFTVVVVPQVPIDPETCRSVVDAPQPDPGLLTVAAERLESGRLLTAEVFVEGPTYLPIDVLVTLNGRAPDLASIRLLLTDALARHLDPLVGDAGDGWPFGAPVRPSDLLGVAQDALGAAADIAAIGVGVGPDVDWAEPNIDCHDIELRANELPQLVTVAVGNGPPTTGVSGPPGGLR